MLTDTVSRLEVREAAQRDLCQTVPATLSQQDTRRHQVIPVSSLYCTRQSADRQHSQHYTVSVSRLPCCIRRIDINTEPLNYNLQVSATVHCTIQEINTTLSCTSHDINPVISSLYLQPKSGSSLNGHVCLCRTSSPQCFCTIHCYHSRLLCSHRFSCGRPWQWMESLNC